MTKRHMVVGAKLMIRTVQDLGVYVELSHLNLTLIQRYDLLYTSVVRLS